MVLMQADKFIKHFSQYRLHQNSFTVSIET